ncbi:Gag-Pol polyprotein/retrotransposon [Ceratobasidium sp. AG-Ba]|nr:Gag-Pol polyprotein/retrotransposon [Ceratobasidium sp. AG-Ba]
MRDSAGIPAFSLQVRARAPVEGLTPRILGAGAGIRQNSRATSLADCPITRKSHSGYVTILAGAAVSWSSKKQAIVTTSSTDAEYIGMGHCAKEGVWITQLLKDLGAPLLEPIEIFADNQSSMILADSEKNSSRTKHIDMKYHFIREYIQDGKC